MNFSIITPIHNEEKNIEEFLKQIENIDYNNNFFEIIFINDGSKDKSLKLLKQFQKKSKINSKIIKFQINKGRFESRIEGVKASKYNNILLLDAKCLIKNNTLKIIKELNQNIICGTVDTKKNSTTQNFLNLIRNKTYKSTKEDIFINQKNFDQIGKGTGLLFIKKSIFLKSIPKNIDKNSSDDTALFKNILKFEKILKTNKLQATYNSRQGLIKNLKHIFQRGPKFVDYYYKPNKNHFWLINLSIIFLTILIIQTIKYKLFFEILAIFLILNTIISTYLAKTIKDFIISFFLSPLFFSSFFLGILKGLIIKIYKK